MDTIMFVLVELALIGFIIYTMAVIGRLQRRWNVLRRIIAEQHDYVPEALRADQQDVFRYATNWWVKAFIRQMNELDGTKNDEPPTDITSESDEMDEHGAAA